jgi:hypothetical protein
VPLNEYEFPTSKLANVQSQLERLVEKNYYLHQGARDAYRCGGRGVKRLAAAGQRQEGPSRRPARGGGRPQPPLAVPRWQHPLPHLCTPAHCSPPPPPAPPPNPRAYILAYNSHGLKDVYNVHSLDLKVRGRRGRLLPCGRRGAAGAPEAPCTAAQAAPPVPSTLTPPQPL